MRALDVRELLLGRVLDVFRFSDSTFACYGKQGPLGTLL